MKYKVGDKVRIRQWDDMKEEFGRDRCDGIGTPKYYFIKKMENIVV